MTGEIPSGMVLGEDGRGRKLSAQKQGESTKTDNSNRLPGEGLATVPAVLAAKHDEWAKRELAIKENATLSERTRLRELAEKEGKL